MSNDSNFFGTVFEDPNDDPLLEEEKRSGCEPSEPSHSQEQPSWVDGEGASGTASSSNTNDNEACRKQVVVDQRRDEAKGLDELNRAVDQGWRLVHLSLDRPNGEQATSRRAAHRFVAILEQEEPRSLFDFGCTS